MPQLDEIKRAREIGYKAGEQLALEKQGQAYLEGKQSGIREVVEEARKNGIEFIPEKLKEWGINETSS